MANQGIRSSLRIAIAQFDPKLGQVQRNIRRVEELLTPMTKGSTDLLILPEMALTGYVFRTPDAIRPHLEPAAAGATTLFARELARRFGCTVVAGYPQYPGPDERVPETLAGANAAVVCDQGGTILCDYRKTNMYDTDLPWCIPGTGFAAFDLKGVRYALGICMDLNPDRNVTSWSMEEGPFELADFVIKENARVLILICAWLDSKENSGSGAEDADTSTLRFWVARLDPLWKSHRGDRVVLIANRCGEEDGELFAGSSLVLQYSAERDQLVRTGGLGRKEEALLRCTAQM